MIRYEQFTMYATQKLKGSYSYKDYINIFPSKIDEKPFHRAESFTVEIAFKKEDPYYRYGSPFNSTTLGKKMLETTHILSLFLMYQIPYAEPSNNIIHSFSKSDLPTPIGEPQFYLNTLFDDRNVDELLIPKDINLMFEAYLGLDNEKHNIFRNAMYLFYAGVTLEQDYKSLSFLSLVSAIETLANATFSQKGKYIKRKFIKDLSHVKDEEYIKKLYKHRCDFVQSGHVLLSDRVWDINRSSLKGSSEDDYFARKNLIKIARICLLNWLINNYRNDNGFILKLDQKDINKSKWLSLLLS